MDFLATLIALLVDAFTGRKATPVPPVDADDLSDPVAPVPPEVIEEPEVITENYGTAGPIIRAMQRLGHEVFGLEDGDDAKDLNLNIVGVRDPMAKVDVFSCRLHVFWKFAGVWKHFDWKITTFPGSRYLVERLLNVRGAAILVPGQYKGIYKLDLHGGRYRALCQRNGSVRVYRDGNRDREFDLEERKIQTGSFGINIHAPVTVRAGMTSYIASRVYAASAGCQVFQSLADFLEFRSLCDRAAKLWGNRFTYTLITEDDLAPISQVVRPRSEESFDDAEETDFADGVAATGVRQKNLLNVKGADQWLYSLGRDSRGHHIFPSYAKGLRAGIINLRSYYNRRGLRSISAILSRWAPSSDTIGSLPGARPNSPRDYSLFVSGRMGDISPYTQLKLFKPDGAVDNEDHLFALVAAMVAYENKATLKLPRAIFDEAVALM